MESFIGNQIIVKQITKLARLNSLPNTMLFVGPNGIGKSTLADYISSLLLKTQDTSSISTHSEYIKISKSEQSSLISVDDIREALYKLTTKTFKESARVVVIDSAHDLSKSAANALLKAIEEPSQKTYFFLLAEHVNTIPRTVLSRSACYFFSNAPDIDMKTLVDSYDGVENKDKIVIWSSGRPGILIGLCEKKEEREIWMKESHQLFDILKSSSDVRLNKVEEMLVKSKNKKPQKFVIEKIDKWIIMLRSLIFTHGSNSRKLLESLLFSIDCAQKVKQDIQKNIQPKALLDKLVLTFPKL